MLISKPVLFLFSAELSSVVDTVLLPLNSSPEALFGKSLLTYRKLAVIYVNHKGLLINLTGTEAATG